MLIDAAGELANRAVEIARIKTEKDAEMAELRARLATIESALNAGQCRDIATPAGAK